MPDMVEHARPGVEASPAKRQATESHSVLSPIDKTCIATIRCIGAELPQLANSGHPGAPMGCAPMAHALWGHVMKFAPTHPEWWNRDRFVLSNGHACALQYTMLHLSGYNVSREDLKRFRQLESTCPGHPECFATPGVEVCSGPLGQGVSNAVGMAIGEANLAATFNRTGFEIFNAFTYVICGDGCLQEGVASEAASLAGHLGLGKLIVLYDANNITIDGNTDLSFTEDVPARFQSYGWQTIDVADGDSGHIDVLSAIERAKSETGRPTLIKIKTTIGYGSSKQGTEKVHGSPLGGEEITMLKEGAGLNPTEPCKVPDGVAAFYKKVAERGNEEYAQWEKLFKSYKDKYAQEGSELERRFKRELPNYGELLPKSDSFTKAESTRVLSGTNLNAILPVMPELIGGSADLTGSNSSAMKGVPDFTRTCREGRYLRFGVREHAMAAICNGLFAFGGFRPFCATFLNFVTYAWGAVRLSALSRFGVLYIATHDSIELGEDGPTHQPIEVAALVRATPNMLYVRPADGRECVGAYEVWLSNTTRPTVLALCRSGVEQICGTSSANTQRGGYVVSDWTDKSGTAKDVVVGGSGSELQIASAAAEALRAEGFNVRLVSMPCWDLFEEQDEQYKQEVIPTSRLNVPRIYVEAAATFGWEKYFNLSVGMTTFGASAPKKDLFEHFGITSESVVAKVKQALS